MNISKKVLVWITILMVFISTNTFAALPEDITGTDYEEAVSLLMGLNLMDGNEDGTFLPENSITRAEFSKVMCQALGLTEVANENAKGSFDDVSDDYWAAGFIKAVSDLEVINGYGDGSFGPDDPVLYEQAVKILVSAMGYDVYAKQHGGYPVGYLTLAAEKGLQKKVMGQVGDFATRGMVAQLLYNALDAEVMKQIAYGTDSKFSIKNEQTFLTEKLKIFKENGQVTGNKNTTLDGSGVTSEDDVKISGVLYKKGTTNAEDLLGYQVTFYYKEDKDSGGKILLYVEADKTKNKVLTVAAENIVNYVDHKFTYWIDKEKDSKPEEISISHSADLIYNHKVESAVTHDKLVVSSGKVEMVDINSDHEYDVIIVTEYINCIVQSVNLQNKIVYNKYDATQNLDLGVTGYGVSINLKQQTGEPLALKDLREWDVLTVQKSTDGKIITAYLVLDKIDGMVTESSGAGSNFDQKVVINGKEYKVAASYQNSGEITISIGDEGTFYLDLEGHIAAVHKSSSNMQYGYLINVGPQEGLKKGLKFKICTTSGKTVAYKSAESLKINGKSLDKYDFANSKDPNVIKKGLSYKVTRETNTTYRFDQVVRYALDNNGQVSAVDLAYDSSNAIEENESQDSLRRFYQAKNKVFRAKFATFDGELNMYPKTIIYAVSNEPNEDPVVIKMDTLKDSGTFSDLEAYNATEGSDIPAVLTLYGIMPQTKLAIDGYPVMVNKITNVTNSEGYIVQKLNGIVNGKDEMNVLAKDNRVLAGVKKGDLIKFTYTEKGEINACQRILDIATGKKVDAGDYASNDNDYGAESFMVYGSVYSKEEGLIRVAPYTIPITAVSTTQLKNFSPGLFYSVYEYDLSNPERGYFKGSASDIIDYLHSHRKYSKVFIYGRWAEPKLIIIYNE